MLFNEFDANSDYPYGRVNPAAAPEIEQFHFMIGTFDCTDELLINGEWKTMKAVWQSNYTLNGYAIQDHYRNEVYAGTSLRVYNQATGLWNVSFFGMAGNHSGLWTGSRDGNRIVLTSEQVAPDGSKATSRLSFSEITDSSFEWLGERISADGTVTPNWKISARRRE